MSCAAIAITCCLLAQASENPSRFEPKLVPRAAPAAGIEEDPPAARHNRSVPADDALGAPEGEPERPSPPPNRYDEPTHGRRRDEPETHRRDEPEADAGGSKQKVRPPEILAEALARP